MDVAMAADPFTKERSSSMGPSSSEEEALSPKQSCAATAINGAGGGAVVHGSPRSLKWICTASRSCGAPSRLDGTLCFRHGFRLRYSGLKNHI